jgi:hypothetical protein
MYKDNAINRRLGRVGMKYGATCPKWEEPEKKKPKVKAIIVKKKTIMEEPKPKKKKKLVVMKKEEPKMKKEEPKKKKEEPKNKALEEFPLTDQDGEDISFIWNSEREHPILIGGEQFYGKFWTDQKTNTTWVYLSRGKNKYKYIGELVATPTAAMVMNDDFKLTKNDFKNIRYDVLGMKEPKEGFPNVSKSLRSKQEPKKEERNPIQQVFSIGGVRGKIFEKKQKILKKELKYDPMALPRLKVDDEFKKVDVFTATGKNPKTYYAAVRDIQARTRPAGKYSPLSNLGWKTSPMKAFIIKKTPDSDEIIGAGDTQDKQFVSQFRFVQEKTSPLSIFRYSDDYRLKENQPKNIQKYWDLPRHNPSGDYAWDSLIKFKKPIKNFNYELSWEY